MFSLEKSDRSDGSRGSGAAVEGMEESGLGRNA